MLLDIRTLVKSNDLLPDDELKELNAQRGLIQEELDAIQASLERQTLEDSDGTSSSPPISPGACGRRRKQLLAELSAYDTILAPHKRLPAELLSQIFILSYPDATFIPIQRRCSPVVLSHVCSKWRSIALETPELWADLVLRFAAYTLLEPPQAIDVAEEWFKRGGRTTKSFVLMNQLRGSSIKWDQAELLLSVLNRLVVPLAPTLGRLQLILPRSILGRLFRLTPSFPRLRELSVIFHVNFEDEEELDESTPFDSHLNMFNKASFPRLVHLKLAKFWSTLALESILDLPWGSLTRLNLSDTSFSLDECHSLLAKCKLLEECTLSISIRSNDSPDPAIQLSLPHLSTLSVDFCTTFLQTAVIVPPTIGSFFLPLALPGLKTLTISPSSPPMREPRPQALGLERFMRFLAQSGSSLEILDADLRLAYSQQRSASEVEVIATALPTLVELRLPTHHAGGSLGADLVSKIREGELLPNLQVLIGRVGELQSILDLLERRLELSESREKSELVSKLQYVMVDYEGAGITTAQAAHIDRLRDKGIGIHVNHV